MARGWKRVREHDDINNGMFTFDEKELETILGYERGDDFFEVGCGCTSQRHGDYIGKLRVNSNGQFWITCHCYDGCTVVNVTPNEFETHAQKGLRNWKCSIWVHINDEKVPLYKSSVMRYYTHQTNVANWIDMAYRKRNFHRDEFLRCSICDKERRFRLRTRDEIQKYHAALTNETWNCSDWLYHKITCDDEEERPSLKNGRGCPRASFCTGCEFCDCKGCIKCRFENCSCQECRNFMWLAEA